MGCYFKRTTVAAVDDSASLTEGWNPSTHNVTATTVVLDLAKPAGENYELEMSDYPNIRLPTHEVMAGGYFGRGFSRFIPGDGTNSGTGEHYCGVGEILNMQNVGDSRLCVFGELVRFGPSLFENSRANNGNMKRLLLLSTAERVAWVTNNRPGLTNAIGSGTPGSTNYAPFGDVDYPDSFNDEGWTPDLNDYLGVWLWIEYWVDKDAGHIGHRIWSSDGTLTGQGIETHADFDTSLDDDGEITHVDAWAYLMGLETVDSDSYIDVERVEIRIGTTTAMTPPTGFPGSTR